MKKLHRKRDGALQVISQTQPNDQQITLLTSDERILCFKRHPNGPFEPMEPEHLGLVLAIGRL